MMRQTKPSLLILGTRGIPAAHGGFETFAEKLALFLAAKGWNVGVYCQNEVEAVTRRTHSDMWNDIERIHIQVSSTGPRATLDFDWHCVRDAAKREGVCLVLGYNGAVFLPYLRLRGRKVITNMDGIEWRRKKWGPATRAWFWINEWIAAWSSNRLVADHPAIADHLATRRPRSSTVMIPYGGKPVVCASAAPVRALGLEPDRYIVSVARIEPDNSILTLVEAFSDRPRDTKLVILGQLRDDNPYHRRIVAAASGDVVLAGAIYDKSIVEALRFHARAYVHGHTVGGTNPSLVESLSAGNAVIAHDNVYNRWTAGAAAVYFDGIEACRAQIDAIVGNDMLVARCRAAAKIRAATFDWGEVLAAYEREAGALLSGPSGKISALPTPAATAANSRAGTLRADASLREGGRGWN